MLVNNRVSGLAARIRTDPLLQGLILPHAFRAILRNLNPSGESEEEDHWSDNWRRFLSDLGVTTEAEEPNDPESVDDWVETAARAFVDVKEFAARVKLVTSAEAADA